MSGRSLAAHVWRLREAELAGDVAAGRRLYRLARQGVRAGQCVIDVTVPWHRHPGRALADSCCLDDACPEASDGVVWAASWEAWWPPGKHPRERM